MDGVRQLRLAPLPDIGLIFHWMHYGNVQGAAWTPCALSGGTKAGNPGRIPLWEAILNPRTDLGQQGSTAGPALAPGPAELAPSVAAPSASMFLAMMSGSPSGLVYLAS